MSDLRKAANMALEFIVLVATKDKPWFTEKEFEVVAALRQALAQPEQETRVFDRGCWERGCIAYDDRDSDGVVVQANIKEKNT